MADQDKPVPTTAYQDPIVTGILVNANWLKLSNYDKVVPNYSQDAATYSYYENNALVGEARLQFISASNWNLELEAFVNDADGSVLQDDDGTRLTLD